jgi:hypothetical protein
MTADSLILNASIFAASLLRMTSGCNHVALVGDCSGLPVSRLHNRGNRDIDGFACTAGPVSGSLSYLVNACAAATEINITDY